jgi:hypothetical protein
MRLNRVVLTAVLLTALEAFTSERHDQLDLAAVLARSSVVAIVERADPPTKKTEISIAPKGGSSEKYPAYSRTRFRYVVKALLHQAVGQTVEVGQTLEVDEADFDTRLTVHTRYHLEGVRKIPIYSYYTPKKPGVDGPIIIFIDRSGDGWEFTASGAIEHLDTRAQVEALLKKKGAR